ncbi:DUF2219 domain-containing protein [Falsiroseomonas bella]|uniref:DUF2219 domain-containing protein n=1 Tax=Falsiroseomonas bella TaxID=2184016 RepID=A0A317FE08_9PROT|nr:DUF2219 domain-containing protein [Falsiroseomonas bella]
MPGVRGVSRRTTVVATALLLLAATPAAAQTVPGRTVDPSGTFVAIYENDTFSGNDRYYTNGLLFAWRSPSYDPPAWLAGLTERPNLLFPSGGVARWGVALGQKIWTPEDTERHDPDPTDRPYAGWLYGSLTLMSYTPTALGSLELQLGVVGPSSLAEQVQSNAHDLINVPRAEGWNYQLKDEPGVNLILTRQWRVNRPTGVWDGVSVGVVPSVTASLGNVATYAAAGGMLRIGTELEADFGPPRVRPASAGSVFYQPVERWGWYAFAGVEGRVVAHDISLDGNTWRDSRSVEREPLVGDASLGVALITPWARLTASYTIRSEEFTTQREPAQFGSISVAFRF